MEDGDDLDLLDLDSPFDEPAAIVGKSPASSSKKSATRKRKGFSVESILENRQRRQALQAKTQAKMKQLGESDDDDDDDDDGEDEFQKKYEESTDRIKDELDAKRMEELAKHVNKTIGEADEEDLEPSLFLGIEDFSRVCEEAYSQSQRGAVNHGEGLSFCLEACKDHGLDFEECQDLLLDEVLSGGWLDDTLHTIHSGVGGEGMDAGKSLWLREISGRPENAFACHFATEALCSTSTDDFEANESPRGGQSDQIKSIVGASLDLLKDCLEDGQDPRHANLAVIANLRRLHFLLVERRGPKGGYGGAGAATPLLKSPKDAANLFHHLTQVLACKTGGLVYDLALSVCAQVLAQVDAKQMKVVCTHLFDLYTKIETEEANLTIDDAENARSSSIFYALSRVLRDVYFEAAANVSGSTSASANALHLIGLRCLRSLSALTDARAPSSASMKKFASLGSIEKELLDRVKRDDRAITDGALGAKGKHGLWCFHDLLKMADLFLSCLPPEAGEPTLLETDQQRQRDWIDFLKELAKRVKRNQRESARAAHVIAQEMMTAYELRFRSIEMWGKVDNAAEVIEV